MGIFADENKKAVARATDAPTLSRYKRSDRIANRFEIYDILGGGMGVIYVCYDHESHSVVVLKSFQDGCLSSKEAQDGFKKEARLWIQLESHPYIVRAHWVDELDYRIYVACEHIAPDENGKNTLSHYLKEKVSLEQVLTWAMQFCHGMEHAKSKGVTPHRDIKPDNIMVTNAKTLKITDFGLAGAWQDSDSLCDLNELAYEKKDGLTFVKKTHRGMICGTRPWMAPEQFDGATDVRSDIYSFGVVMYQMVNGGRLPFYTDKPEEWGKLHKGRCPSVIDSVLASIIYKCLEKSPDKRYDGFGELRGDIETLWRENFPVTPIPSAPTITELEAWEHSNKGVYLSRLGLIDEAIVAYHKALRIEPDHASVHNNLWAFLKAKGLRDESIEAFRIKPDQAEVHYNLGTALYDKGLIDEAIEAYHKALRIKPDYADAHNNLGIALSDKGLIGEAIEAYKEALRIKPDLAEAHYNLGNALSDKGLIDEAIEAFENFIRYAPPQYANYVEDIKALIENLKRNR
ncbi:tetratricopeptide repeat protein [Candidatus Magnetobacterium casense]|uniref:serine/threonine-protein kinase n=1 Tax=Candidatus Magnetobacterium casense TaxID=1455061 RepID=UPI000697D4EB|nr:serine/threonine-protein kinase [Candidatus Magnetobacterium casensis]